MIHLHAAPSCDRERRGNSAAMAVKRRLDLNCGSAFLHLQEAYEKGLVSEGRLIHR